MRQHQGMSRLILLGLSCEGWVCLGKLTLPKQCASSGSKLGFHCECVLSARGV